MEKTLILRCSDGRNALGLMLGFPDFQELKILETPQIAASTPRDIVHCVIQNDVSRVFVINHTTLPYLEGCGGLDNYKKLNGSKDRLAKWLKLKLSNSDPLIQAKATGKLLSQSLPGDIEITAFLFDHLLQRLFPVGTKLPYKQWQWIGYYEWRCGFTIYPTLLADQLSIDTREFMQMNHAVSTYAGVIAKASNYQKGQSFHNLVLNATVYPPETVWQELGCFEADPYFSVYVSSMFPSEAVTQMEYAIRHLNHPADLWIISQDTLLISQLCRLLEDSACYRKNRQNINIKGVMVTSKPY